MVEFNSIVVLDLETTSLPCYDFNTTKITELAILGCEVRHLKSSAELPRVLPKLVLLFNPNKPIHPAATKTSGLDNESLENMKPFTKEDGDMLKQFITRLPAPVCIVAHNGKKFDFPILRRALVKLQTEFGNDVYCADSLAAFKEIYGKEQETGKHVNTAEETIQVNCEKTPHNKKTTPSNILNYKGENRSGVMRKLCLDDDELENLSSARDAPHLSGPAKYNLAEIYKFLHGKDFANAHRAEYDCLALLECIIRCDEFLNWVKDHSKIFDSIPPLF